VSVKEALNRFSFLARMRSIKGCATIDKNHYLLL
jgi:hypothetical protein